VQVRMKLPFIKNERLKKDLKFFKKQYQLKKPVRSEKRSYCFLVHF
jgi:hypothetical protein